MSNDELRPLVYSVEGYTGFDMWLNLLPLAWQARMIAKAWLKQIRSTGAAIDFTQGRLVIQMRKGSFEIVDIKGHVKPSSVHLRPPTL